MTLNSVVIKFQILMEHEARTHNKMLGSKCKESIRMKTDCKVELTDD